MSKSKEQIEKPDGAGHQPDKVNVARVLQIGAALAVIVVASMVLMVYFIGAMQQHSETGLPQSAVLPLEQQPPLPRLDPDQPAQLAELRQYEERMLTDYQWIDEQNEVARIPIDRAMDIVLREDFDWTTIRGEGGQTTQADGGPTQTSGEESTRSDEN